MGAGTLRFVWQRVKVNNSPLTPEMLGMTLAHMGIAVFLVGALLVEAMNVQREIAMKPGQSLTLGRDSFRLLGVEHHEGPNYVSDKGSVEVLRDGKRVTILHPEKRRYVAGGQVMTEAGIRPGVTRDVYVAIGEPLGGDAWAVRVHVKPYVRWIWLGALMMMLGAFVTAVDRRFRGRQATPAPAPAPTPATTAEATP